MRPARPWIAAACLFGHTLGLVGVPAYGGTREEPAAEPRPAGAEADSSGTRIWVSGKRSNRSTWGVVGSAAGMLAGAGLAVWLKAEADDRYDLYLTTADPEAAAAFLDEAERYDRTALIGFVVAQASFVGFVYFLTRGDDRELVPVRGEPVLRLGADGPQVGVRIRP